MNTDKTSAQLRGQILADIEAVRMGLMPKETAAVCFAGYKLMNDSINTEIAHFKATVTAKATGVEFAKAVRFGKLIVNGEDDSSGA